MKLRFRNYAGLVAMMLAVGWAPAHADEPARQRGTPIIFSEPKSDTVSSNLNQLDLKASPFKGLESDLKKPFEIFDSGRSIGSFRPPSGLTAPPPPAPANNRRIKDLIDKRAEMMLPGPDSGDTDLGAEDPFQTAEDSRDATGRKLKTPLDRYYDRLDRERTAFTNQVRNTDLFGNKKSPDGKEQFSRPFSESLFDGNLKASARSLDRLSNSAVVRGGFFSEDLKPKTFDDLFDVQLNKSPERSSDIKETRLDEFKRLLGGPAFVPSSNYYSPPSLPVVGAARRPEPVSPWPTWSSSSAPANPRDSFTSRAGLVGAPPQLQSLPSFAVTTPSLNPTPPPVLQLRQPPPSFSIPKRQF